MSDNVAPWVLSVTEKDCRVGHDLLVTSATAFMLINKLEELGACDGFSFCWRARECSRRLFRLNPWAVMNQ